MGDPAARHVVCLLVSAPTLQEKVKISKKNPSDSQRDLKELTGNEITRSWKTDEWEKL